MLSRSKYNQQHTEKGGKRQAMRKFFKLFTRGSRSALDAICASSGFPIMINELEVPKDK